MPRTGRGGAREGQPGKAYANRVDLNGGSAMPAGKEVRSYGGGGPKLDVPTATSGPPAAGGGAATPSPAAPPPVLPGQLTPLGAPSQRPDEPVTAGLPVGPGAGPEALPINPAGPSVDVVELVRYLPALEHMQKLPNLSRKTRNLIRMLRASVPPEARVAAQPPAPQPEE